MRRTIFFFTLLLLTTTVFSQTPILPADYDQKISNLKKQLGQAVDVLTLGLEIYQVVNSPDIESALENFVAKTGIQLYPSLLLKTKDETANKFFAEFAQLRQSSYQEPYLILELTFSDSSAAFKVSPSPGLEKHRKKIQELCNVHIGGFLSGKNKLSLLGNVPKLSLSLRDLADSFAESGIVDKVGQGLKNLYEIVKQSLQEKRDISWKSNREAIAKRDSVWKLVATKRNDYFEVDLQEVQDTTISIASSDTPTEEIEGMFLEETAEKDTSDIKDPALKDIFHLEDLHSDYKAKSIGWKSRIEKIAQFLSEENLNALTNKMVDEKQIKEIAVLALSGDDSKLKAKVSDYLETLLASKQ